MKQPEDRAVDKRGTVLEISEIVQLINLLPVVLAVLSHRQTVRLHDSQLAWSVSLARHRNTAGTTYWRWQSWPT